MWVLGLCVSCVCSEDRSSGLSGSFYFASQTSAKDDPSCRSTLFPDTSSPPSPQLQIYLVSGRGETGLKIHLLPLHLESIFLLYNGLWKTPPRVKVREGYSQGGSTLAIWDITLPRWFPEPSTW